MFPLWLIYAFFAFFGYFMVNLIFKLVSAENPYLMSLVLYSCATLAVLPILLSERTTAVSFRSVGLAALAGIFSVIATVFALKSIKLAPNPGYSVAIYSANFVLLALLSVLIFGSELTLQRMLGVVGIFVGIVLLSV